MADGEDNHVSTCTLSEGAQCIRAAVSCNIANFKTCIEFSAAEAKLFKGLMGFVLFSLLGVFRETVLLLIALLLDSSLGRFKVYML